MHIITNAHFRVRDAALLFILSFATRIFAPAASVVATHFAHSVRFLGVSDFYLRTVSGERYARHKYTINHEIHIIRISPAHYNTINIFNVVKKQRASPSGHSTSIQYYYFVGQLYNTPITRQCGVSGSCACTISIRHAHEYCMHARI